MGKKMDKLRLTASVDERILEDRCRMAQQAIDAVSDRRAKDRSQATEFENLCFTALLMCLVRAVGPRAIAAAVNQFLEAIGYSDRLTVQKDTFEEMGPPKNFRRSMSTHTQQLLETRLREGWRVIGIEFEKDAEHGEFSFVMEKDGIPIAVGCVSDDLDTAITMGCLGGVKQAESCVAVEALKENRAAEGRRRKNVRRIK